MNRGNLAEDPQGGLPSSSRYSRMDAENRLLYTSSLGRKGARSEKDDSSHEANSSSGIKKEKKKSVGRSLSSSHMSRLEVGSDGRLFGVHIAEKLKDAKDPGKVPAILPGTVPESSASLPDVPTVSTVIRSLKADVTADGENVYPLSSEQASGRAVVYSSELENEKGRPDYYADDPDAPAREDASFRPEMAVSSKEAVSGNAGSDAGMAADPVKAVAHVEAADLVKTSDTVGAADPVTTAGTVEAAAPVKAGIEGSAADRETESAAVGEIDQLDAQAGIDSQALPGTEKADLSGTGAKAVSRKRKKPDRPYLADSENPLLSKKTLERVKAGKINEKKDSQGRKKDPSGSVEAASGITLEAGDQAIPSPASGAVPFREKIPALFSSFKERYRTGIIVTIAGVMAAGYIYAGYHFSNHFYPGTEFFGIASGGKTVEEVKAAAQVKVSSYELSIVERDGADKSGLKASKSGDGSVPANLAYEWGCTAAVYLQDHLGGGHTDDLSEGQARKISTSVMDTVSARQIGLRYEDHGEIEEAMDSQIPALWPIMMIVRKIQGQPYELDTYYDSIKAENVVNSLSCFDEKKIVAPEDAVIAYTDDRAYVSREIMGTALDVEAARAAVFDALDKGISTVDFEKSGFYQNPSVYSDDPSLNKEVRRLNKVLGTDMVIDFADRSEHLNAEKTISLISSKDNGKYYIDEEKVRDYVSSLAQRFDTIGTNRTFYTSLGTTVELEGGNYGWELDQEASYEEILSALKNKKHGTMEPVYIQTAMSRRSNDIGDTYIEISISNQRMWMYHEGELIVDTPVVTGDPLKNNETPAGGVWRVFDIQRNTTLRGEGYVTPVDYWVGFNGGVGIHDLQSRYYFGGQIYMGAGSHGCVNTPLSAVKLVYQAADYGMPVVVYEDDSQAAIDAQTGAIDAGTINSQVEEKFGTVEDDGQGSIVQWTATHRYQTPTGTFN